MGILVKDFAMGRKTFFVSPDVSLFPENYLEEYFILGYECYFITFDRKHSITETVDNIISVFGDVILIFNIDYESDNFSWEEYIKELQEKYGENVCIGVTFLKKADKAHKVNLEKYYLYDVGIKGGCIQLEYKKTDNFVIIQKLLYANQAQGRRKNIRALCTKNYTYSLIRNQKNISGTLQDISLSHFSFIMPDSSNAIADYERIPDITLYLNGFIVKTKAIMIMHRETKNGTLYVFAFVLENNSVGLEERYKRLLVPCLSSLMNTNFENLMKNIERVKQDESSITKDEINELEINQ